MAPENIRIDGSLVSRYVFVPPPLSPPRSSGFRQPGNIADGCVIDLNRHERGYQARIAYESAVRALLAEIGTSLVGGILLDAIGSSRKTLLIKPYVQSEPNAITSLKSKKDALARGATVYLGWPDQPTSPFDERFAYSELRGGTGRGSDCEITFSPEIRSFPELPSSISKGLPMDASAILVHEFVHAVRYLTGTGQIYPLSDPAAYYKDTEEFVAVLIANIYASERGVLILRGDYTSPGFIRMDPQFMEKGKFFDTSTDYGRANVTALGQARLDPILARRIANVPARFNPLRDLFEDYNRVSGEISGILRALGL